MARRCTGVGPLFDPAVDQSDPASEPVGSLVFFNAASDDEARGTVESDPFNEVGLYESMFIARQVLACSGVFWGIRPQISFRLGSGEALTLSQPFLLAGFMTG